MATGMDKLLEHLLTEIALRGVQGKHDSLRVFVGASKCTCHRLIDSTSAFSNTQNVVLCYEDSCTLGFLVAPFLCREFLSRSGYFSYYLQR